MRVFLLQPEEPGAGQCAGYGDSAGTVSGVVDGGGLFGYIGIGMLQLFWIWVDLVVIGAGAGAD